LSAKNITFRLDETLKKQAEIIYESMGLNMSSALQLFVTQTVAKGSIPFSIEADDKARHRAYILGELAESKKEALDSDNLLEDHDDFLREWDTKRKARHNALCNQEAQNI
jgi:DNA-damage-inducible protein J